MSCCDKSSSGMNKCPNLHPQPLPWTCRFSCWQPLYRASWAAGPLLQVEDVSSLLHLSIYVDLEGMILHLHPHLPHFSCLITSLMKIPSYYPSIVSPGCPCPLSSFVHQGVHVLGDCMSSGSKNNRSRFYLYYLQGTMHLPNTHYLLAIVACMTNITC